LELAFRVFNRRRGYEVGGKSITYFAIYMRGEIFNLVVEKVSLSDWERKRAKK